MFNGFIYALQERFRRADFFLLLEREQSAADAWDFLLRGEKFRARSSRESAFYRVAELRRRFDDLNEALEVLDRCGISAGAAVSLLDKEYRSIVEEFYKEEARKN